VTPPATFAASASSTQRADDGVTLYIGGIHVSRHPVIIKTLLGSCISVCLWDPPTRIGGMNHFMLPRGGGSSYGSDAARFGVHAMDCLIGEMMKLGADRRRLVAKVFGGAHVLDIKVSAVGVPQQNIEFIREFLQSEGMRILAEDMGGYHPRHVHFFTENGRARVKRLTSSRARTEVLGQERVPEPAPPRYGDITLFE
jgi:chemotaxis receptor (MCP) glutamine deamidase CheD